MRKMNTDPNRNTLYGNLKNVPIDQLAAIKELIDNSPPAHRISLTNGSIIEGTIIKDANDCESSI